MSEKIVQLNEEVIKGQIKELVRGSVEEALIEMYLAGVSVRRVEDIRNLFKETIAEFMENGLEAELD